MTRAEIARSYETHKKRLFHISFSITRDAYLAEDAVQETFIKALNKADTIKEKEKLGAWLSVTAARTAIDFVRRERKKVCQPMEIEAIDALGLEKSEAVESLVEARLMKAQINRAISLLGEGYRDILHLRASKGLKEREIAEILNLKPCTVKTRLYRARKRLKPLFMGIANI
jgi:RNA polymerase sigma factor (sigma-70 family)